MWNSLRRKWRDKDCPLNVTIACCHDDDGHQMSHANTFKRNGEMGGLCQFGVFLGSFTFNIFKVNMQFSLI